MTKRDNIFQYLQNIPPQIFLLQETHSISEVIQKCEKEWKGKSYWYTSTKKKFPEVAIQQHNNRTSNNCKR